jgi:hypothetical protein
MRLIHGALWIACIALAAAWPLPSAYGQQEGPIRPKAGAAPAETDEQSEGDGSGKKDTRLSMKDIQRMRRQRMSPEQVSDSIAEQGRSFGVTADIARQLRGLARARQLVTGLKTPIPRETPGH